MVETSTDFREDVNIVQSVGVSNEVKPRRTQQTVHSREKTNGSGDLSASEWNGLFQVTRKCTKRLYIKSRENGVCLIPTGSANLSYTHSLEFYFTLASEAVTAGMMCPLCRDTILLQLRTSLSS